MASEDTTPRKRGRPPKPKDELSRRPTVALRVPVELYDTIVAAAAKNGRSLSEEMEARVTEAFRQSQPQAVQDAVHAALYRQSEKNFTDMGGELGYLLLRIRKHITAAIISEARKRFNIEMPKDLSDEFLDYACARFDQVEPTIRYLWRMQVMRYKNEDGKGPDVMTMLEKTLGDKPELKRFVIDQLA